MIKKKKKMEQESTMETTILQTAEKLFLEKGYSLTSTTEIAKIVGCNQALVHYYFRTKEKLFQRIFEEKMRLFAFSFFSIDNEEGPFLDILRRKIGFHFDILSQNPQLPALIITEFSTNPKRIEEFKKEMGTLPMTVASKINRQIKEAIKKGEIANVSPLHLLMNIIALNAATFIALPIFQSISPMTQETYQHFLAERKACIIDTIIDSIKPIK